MLLFISSPFYSVACVYQYEKQINMHLCPTLNNPTPFSETNPLRWCQYRQRNQSSKIADISIGEPWTEVLKWAYPFYGHGYPDHTHIQWEPEIYFLLASLIISMAFYSSTNSRLYSVIATEATIRTVYETVAIVRNEQRND